MVKISKVFSIYIIFLQYFRFDLVTCSKYEKLGRLNIEPHITVSGLSAGGSLSSMLSFIFSSFVKGAGIFAGGAYPVGVVFVENPVNFFNFTRHLEWIDYLSSRGFIDPTSNLRNGFRAYVFHGNGDNIVPISTSRFLLAEFKHYGVTAIKDRIGTTSAGHCIPTSHQDDVRCTHGGYIAICGCYYSGVNEMFAHLFSTSWVDPGLEVGQQTSGTLFKFDQDEFFPTGKASLHGWLDYGYAYIPRRCDPKTGIVCKLHFAFHACAQNLIGIFLKEIPSFVTDLGYLEAADANDIVIIFPNAYLDTTGSTYNYIGCFDLYGHTSPWRITFATKYGVQPQAVKKIFERILMGKL